MFDNENLTPELFSHLRNVAWVAWDDERIDWAEFESITESIDRLEELL